MVNPSHFQSRIVVTRQQLVDENNPEVLLLLGAKMGTLEQCIRYIEMYGTANLAINIIEGESEEDKGLFQDSTNAPVQQEFQVHVLPSQQVTRSVYVFLYPLL